MSRIGRISDLSKKKITLLDKAKGIKKEMVHKDCIEKIDKHIENIKKGDRK